MSTRSLTRRTAALAAGGALAASGLLVAGPAPVAHAAAPNSPQASASAGWLIDRLGDDHLFTYENYGYATTDVGLTIDLLLGLVERGSDATVRGQIASAVESRATSYAQHATYPTTYDCASFAEIPETTVDTYYSNATAKALTALTTAGVNGATTDALKAQLETVTIDNGADKGRISDLTTQGGTARPDCDYANIYGQAFAVRALDAVGSGEEDNALTYLLDAQNADGSWNQDLKPVGGTAPAAAPAVDGTATTLLQLQQIAPSGALKARTDAAVAKGIAWLASVQAADGSFGATGLFGPNANETGLAGWALGKAGKGDAAAKAAVWLANHQVAKLAGCATGLDAEGGAVAYGDDALAEAETDGITTETEGQWIRSSAAALPALGYLPAGTPSVAPAFAQVGGTVALPIQGAYAGQQVCVTGLGAPQRLTAPATIALTAPATAANHTITVTSVGASTTARLTVLAPGQVAVDAEAKAKRKIKVLVYGLAEGETATVKVGKKQKTATADVNGVATVKIKSKKKGKVKVTATGQFTDRTATTKVRVR